MDQSPCCQVRVVRDKALLATMDVVHLEARSPLYRVALCASKKCGMNSGAVVVDRAELVKWWDVVDDLAGSFWRSQDLRRGLEMARDGRHPEAGYRGAW